MIWKKTTLLCFSSYTACTKIQITNSKYNASISYNRKNAECCTLQYRYCTLQYRYCTLQYRYCTLQYRYCTKHGHKNECYLLSHYFYCKILNVVLLFYLGRSIADYTINFRMGCQEIE